MLCAAHSHGMQMDISHSGKVFQVMWWVPVSSPMKYVCHATAPHTQLLCSCGCGCGCGCDRPLQPSHIPCLYLHIPPAPGTTTRRRPSPVMSC
jgi:hypothetical protein